MSDTKVNVLPEIPASVDNAIKNVTDLPTKGIGQTLSDCWFLAFGGISQLADKRRAKYAHELENFKNELQDSLSKVPEEFKKEPSTQTVLKTLEEAKYCVEEQELRELFTKLLTSATDIRKTVHPSFAQIIGQMSTNDAKLLQCFKHNNIHPIFDLKITKKKDSSFDIISNNIFLEGPDFISQKETSLSISSLIHLGIIEIPADLYFTSDDRYKNYKHSDAYMDALRKYTQDEIEIAKKVVRLTPLGKSFISCCLPDDTSYVIK